MDELGLLAGDVCQRCRHTLDEDYACPQCGWQPEWAPEPRSAPESHDQAEAGDQPAPGAFPPLRAVERREATEAAPRRLPGDDLPGLRGF